MRVTLEKGVYAKFKLFLDYSCVLINLFNGDFETVRLWNLMENDGNTLDFGL